MEQKPFAMGVRIEHPQALISQSQYGKCWTHPAITSPPGHMQKVYVPRPSGVWTASL